MVVVLCFLRVLYTFFNFSSCKILDRIILINRINSVKIVKECELSFASWFIHDKSDEVTLITIKVFVYPVLAAFFSILTATFALCKFRQY